MVKEVIIQKISIKEPKHGETKGKKWTMWPVGIQVNGKWINGTFFNQEDVERLKSIEAGQKQLFKFYKESYIKDGEKITVWKFKFPKIEEENNYILNKIWDKLNEIKN